MQFLVFYSSDDRVFKSVKKISDLHEIATFDWSGSVESQVPVRFHYYLCIFYVLYYVMFTLVRSFFLQNKL